MQSANNDGLPRSEEGAPLTVGEIFALSPDDFGTLPALSLAEIERQAAEEERARVKAWGDRFALARDSVPKRFSWVTPIRPAKHPPCFPWPESFDVHLPWFGPKHCERLLAYWKSGRSILLCGSVGVGKTSLLALLGRWTLAAAAYDAPAVRARRELIASERNIRRADNKHIYVHHEPEHLGLVREARGMRFISAEQLLDAEQRGPNADMVATAVNASLLLLDEIGKEMGRAAPGSYLATARAPAVQNILQDRWNSNKRTFATTMFRPDQLAEFYDLGTFRRLCDANSDVIMIDLSGPDWAGPWLEERARRQPRRAR
jgi:DNA replication protein DnaC